MDSALLYDATFWVAVSFTGFLIVLIIAKVPSIVTGGLDKRADSIRTELDEAARLREEAQALLASYQRKQREAEKEAEDIIADAKAEAERMRREAETSIREQIERRTRMAEDKIAQAEADAVADVRRIAADTATDAARQLIVDNLDTNKSASLIDKNIDALSGKIH